MALPGVKTTILDRFYNLGRTDLPGGPMIAVVAKRSETTTTAPDLTPYYPVSEKEVIEEFGEDSYLHRAYYELTTGGASRIVFIPLPEDTDFNHSTAALTSSIYTTGNVYDDAMGAVEASQADILLAWGRGSAATDWEDPATPGNDLDDFFYADNSNSIGTSWAVKIANSCADITNNSYPIHGVIGLRGLKGPENPTTAQIAQGLALDGTNGSGTLFDRSQTAFKAGHFVSVVATEIRPIQAPSGWGWSNGASQYAAMVSRLDSWSATTGKPVYNVDRVRYNPSRSQAEALINKGVVPVTLDFARAPRWTDGTTFAGSTSDYVRLSTLRIAFDVVKIVRRTSQNYVGEGMTIDVRNAFETQITSNLRAMQQVGAITNSDFRVRYAPSENRAYVDVAVVPAFELREVILTIAINF